MKQKWEEHQDDHPDTAGLVQKGLNKLADYHNHADNVPAYVLAMDNAVVLPIVLVPLSDVELLICTSCKSFSETSLV